MQLLWIFLIIAVLSGFVLMVFYLPQTEPNQYRDEARRLITQFGEGEYIGFDVDPTPPVTKYIYGINNEVTAKILENGTAVPVTEEEKQEIKLLSSTELNVQDRKLSQSKICKMGYQCDITGIISVIDPNTNQKIPPPYSYLITIDCDYRDFCSLTPSLSANERTYPDGTFKYTWVITEKVVIGEYRVTIDTPSQFKDETGKQQSNIAIRMIEVVR